MIKQWLRFHDKQILKKIWHIIFKNHPYAYGGRIIIRILPNSYLSHFEDGFLSGEGPQGIIANLVRAELNKRYYTKNNNQIRKLNREKYWGAKAGKKWHDLKKELLK